MNNSPLLNPSNLADFGPVGQELLSTLNAEKCAAFRSLVLRTQKNDVDDIEYEGNASCTLEVWSRPDQSAFYVRNTQGLEYTLYRNEAALDEDDDHPDVIHLTELAWHLLGYIDVDKLTSEILLPWFPEACYEDDEESDIEWGESTREWLAHSMFNLEC